VGHDEVIVADTHALLWWVSTPDQLSQAARKALDRGPVCFTVITCMEIANLVRRQRISLDVHVRTWFDEVQSLPNVVLLPMTIEVALAAASLPDSVPDPTDRLIVATAMLQGVPLVTKDHKIIASGLVQTIW
jgi:PIN domain nuclease of toxin-antitoxin system